VFKQSSSHTNHRKHSSYVRHYPQTSRRGNAHRRSTSPRPKHKTLPPKLDGFFAILMLMMSFPPSPAPRRPLAIVSVATNENFPGLQPHRLVRPSSFPSSIKSGNVIPVSVRKPLLHTAHRPGSTCRQRMRPFRPKPPALMRAQTARTVVSRQKISTVVPQDTTTAVCVWPTTTQPVLPPSASCNNKSSSTCYLTIHP